MLTSQYALKTSKLLLVLRGFFAQIENQEFTVYAWVTQGAEYA